MLFNSLLSFQADGLALWPMAINKYNNKKHPPVLFFQSHQFIMLSSFWTNAPNRDTTVTTEAFKAKCLSV